MVAVLGVSLTEEQENILESCPPPAKEGERGQLARITAAAGTGKTTTLLALALKGAELGHSSITYITFNKAAVNDGSRRLREAMQEANMGHVRVNAKTIHSCAYGAFVRHMGGGRNDLWGDKRIKKWIAETCKGEINRFCRESFAAIEVSVEMEPVGKRQTMERAYERVVFFIFKTLRQFCLSDLRRHDLDDPQNESILDYYPAKLFHRETQLGFDKKVYNTDTRRRFYVDQAIRLWDLVVKEKINSFDFIMKQVQLLDLRIPGTLLLVDESQDMDGCQVEWTAKRQVGFGTQVYVVGDAAQTIYGFRGAKSKHLMDLPVDKNWFLTASWRFGTNIGRAANCVLFSKHKSAQSKKNKYGQCIKWDPYRVEIGLPKPDEVTSESLLPKWKELDQLTLIGPANTKLMAAVLGLFGSFAMAADDTAAGFFIPRSSSQETVVDSSDDEYDGVESDDEEVSDYDDSDDEECEVGRPRARDLSDEFPKIHVNGGKQSGLATWKRIIKQVGEVFDLYMASRQRRKRFLSPKLFPEFKGRKLTWGVFVDDCEGTELNKYRPTIGFVLQFKDQALKAAKVFKTNVVEMKFTADEADIILTTCHAAKGMEWDNVELCGDFVNLCEYEQQTKDIIWRKEKLRCGAKWQFGFKEWGDDVNLLYVACTRAKLQLSLPASSIVAVWNEFDDLHLWNSSREERPSSDEELKLKGFKVPICAIDAEDLYEDLVAPLREECGLEPGQLLSDTLSASVGADAMQDQCGEDQRRASRTIVVARTSSAAALVTPEKPAKRRRSNRESGEGPPSAQRRITDFFG